ncbi:MAG: extracellular solute-binding protein [Sphaerochaetaceae bacterium]|nr:extracellular solute-binding protein [Sphaerochaetaceae bacterium]
MKKVVLALLVLVMASSMLFAQAASETAATKTVRVMVWTSTMDQKLAPNDIEAKFEAAFPQYDLEFDCIEYDNLDNQTFLSHETGDDYDVIMVNHSSLPAFVAGGVVAPIDDVVAKLDMEYYSKKAVDASIFNGHYYGIPFDPDCRILAYNTKLIHELGFEDPKTTDDVLAIAKAGFEKGYYAMAGGLNRNTFCIYDLGGFMLCWGTPVYSIDANGKYVCNLNTAEAIDYMHWAQEMYACMPHDGNLDNSTARSWFAQGQVLMLWWTPSQIASVLPKFANREDCAFAEMPIGPTGVNGSAMGGYMWSMGSGAKNPEGAKAFIEWALQPETQGQICRGLPSDSRAYDYPPYNVPEYDMFRAQIAKAEYPVALTSVLLDVFDAWSVPYAKCMMGEMTPEEACAAGYKAVQALLDTLN